MTSPGSVTLRGDPPSLVARALHSPRALGAIGVAYAVVPSLAPDAGDGAAWLRVLCATGALLGALPALAIARRLDRANGTACLLVASMAGAVLFLTAVSAALGYPTTAGSVVGPSVLFPAVAYAVATTFLLTVLGATEPERAASPIVAALLLIAFGLLPLAPALASGRTDAWLPSMQRFWLGAGGAVVLSSLAFAHWMPTLVDRLTRCIATAVMRVPAPILVGGSALFALLAAVTVSVVCFGRQPHNADEVAQLWHARILLSGHLSLPVDANPEFFGMDNVVDRGRWYSQFPIGGPAFLALGMAMGGAWLVNPLLLALTVPNLYAFARSAYGEATARATALLFALTPFTWFMAASFMNHVPVLWLVSVALAQLVVWSDATEQRVAWRAAAWLGLALGVAATVRPLDAAIVAAAVGALQWTRLRGRGVRRSSLGVQLLAGAVPVALLLLANAHTTGAPFRFGYEVLYGSAHQLGFHTDPYGGQHTPLRALMYASRYLLELDVALLESPLPAVALIVAGLLFLRRPSRWDRLLLGLVGLQVVAYALYWHEGQFHGPRFLVTAIPAIVLLIARAPFVIGEATTGLTRRAAGLVLPAALLLGWAMYDVEATPIGRVRANERTYESGRVDPSALARGAALDRALVFVREGWSSQVLRRLWALGIPRADATRLFTASHPCAIRHALLAEERPGTPDAGRLVRMEIMVGGFDAEAPPAPACVADLLTEQDGKALYGPFLPANTIGADGRVGGDVVYVIDLGAHNEVLRRRFGDRTWFSYGPHLTRNDPVPTLTPYAPATTR
jgi:4-amino-4-deoxy-L-arabinose transferase-like glycosyltransferase